MERDAVAVATRHRLRMNNALTASGRISISSLMLFPALFLTLLGTPSLAGPDLSSCSIRFYDQTLDHFSFASPPQATFRQRYIVCDKYWSRKADGSRGPIFFYFGNEADVFLYVNHTGLMHENAPAMGAAMIFAEHRYYGRSTPFPDGTSDCLRWLTSDQALADYAQLIRFFKEASHLAPFAAHSSRDNQTGTRGAEQRSRWVRWQLRRHARRMVQAAIPHIGRRSHRSLSTHLASCRRLRLG